MKRIILVVAVALVLLPVGTVQTTSASTESERDNVSGEYTFAPTFDANDNIIAIETPIDDDECLVSIHGTHTFTGALVGEGPSFLYIHAHGPCGFPPLTFSEDATVHGRFNGTVNGKQGSFDYRYTFHVDKDGNLKGKMKILFGTGDLEGLKGRIRIFNTRGPADEPGTYNGYVRFDD